MAAHLVWELVCDVDGCGRSVIAEDPDDMLDTVVADACWGWDGDRLLCADHAEQHETGQPLTAIDRTDAF